ncbi:MMPL family transporter [Flavobacteriales bacterium]|nr:MMPL family transporter [Flavobacteriales bacterium]
MWQYIANIILRNRALILSILFGITIFFGYFATKVGIQYEFANLLPSNDITQIEYKQFKKDFGQDGMIIVIAANDENFYELDKFNSWYKMGNVLKDLKIPIKKNNSTVYLSAIDSVFSEAHLFNIAKNRVDKKFELNRIINSEVGSQEKLDSIESVIKSLEFYKGIINKEESNLHIMMLFINKEIFNSSDRGTLIEDVERIARETAPSFSKLHFSGLPFIRSVTMNKVKSELLLFVLLAMLVTSSLLFFFFRSFKVVLISMIVVVIAVTWSFGTIGLFGFEITVLMGLIPPLMIVIGIPNCIYLINKYQQEYRSHGNKVKSLQRVIRKVGNATFLTNATTSMGFGTFVFTHSSIMKEFGIVASINIICIFFISILVVPIIYSYLSPPSLRHTKHLDKKWLDFSVDKLVVVSTKYRTAVYVITVFLLIIGFYGMSLMHTTGNIVDELPKSEQVVKDLKYFESEINGVMPFELVIKSKDTIYNTFTNLSKIQNLQTALKQEKYLSKSLSLVDAIKFVSQAYGNGKEEKYFLDFSSSKDKKYLSSIVKSKYFKNTFNNEEFKSSNAFVSSFIDSSHTKTRITVQVADIGTASMDSLYDRVKSKIDEILNPEYLQISNIDGLSDLQKDSSYFNVYQNSFWIQSMVQDSLTGGDVELIMDFPIEENDIYAKYGKDKFQHTITNSIESKYLQSSITGSGIVYTKGTNYLVKNLFISLMIAVCVISILMSFLFKSWRMVIVSMVPNLFPLIITSAIMGYVGIPIKPSTILVFSIAFGISIDDTIHFLAKYRQELISNHGNIRKSAIVAIKETGVSMIYTSIILFFGFSIFIASKFGGTQALGVLVSVTLFIAMLANLVLLPSLLLTLEKMLTTKAFRESKLEFLDNEDDIEIEKLDVIKKEEK